MELAKQVNDSITKLCHIFFPTDENLASKQVRHTLTIISSPVFNGSINDEVQVRNKIQKRLAKHNKATASIRFSELCQQLDSKKSIRKRCELLQFLLTLNQRVGGYKVKMYRIRKKGNLDLNGGPEVPNLNLPSVVTNNDFAVADYQARLRMQQHGGWPFRVQPESACTSSGVSSVNTPTSVAPQHRHDRGFLNSPPQPPQQTNRHTVAGRNAYDPSLAKIPEKDLIRDVLFCLQAIDGRYIRFDAKLDDFMFGLTDNISKPVRHLIRKIVECGWLFSRILKMCDSLNSLGHKGSFSLALSACVQQELNEYYRMLAMFQSQLDQQEDQGVNACLDGNSSARFLSLKRIHALLLQPKQKLLLLASALESCKELRGGSMLSVLYSYRNNGDEDLAQLFTRILKCVCRPLLSLLLSWIFEGVLEDPYGEFFILCTQSAKEEHMWTDKYALNGSMLPSFIDESVANKILIAGKSINFLRSICKDRSLLPQLEIKRNAFKALDACALFDNASSDEFRSIIDFVYAEISKSLLDSINNNFSLYSQLLALKKYILLSQGDFARCLMDLLQEDLDRPAAEVHLHNISRHLDASLRQTNAQYEKRDILARLGADLLEKTDEDTGWDVFVLKYVVSGPINTVVTDEGIRSYNRLFDFVWRLKRISFVMSKVWSENVTLKTSPKIVEFSPTVHSFYLLTSEIVYFVEQMQYYFLFEVLECAWDNLEKKLTKAQDLNEVITAHDHYLKILLQQSLLSGHHSGLLDEFRTLVNVIFQFEKLHKSFFVEYRNEVDARVRFKSTTLVVKPPTSDSSVKESELSRRRENAFRINGFFEAQLKVLLGQYRRSLKNFLVDLAQQEDEQLHLLSFRLDFSQFYVSQDPQLGTPLTFRRLSRRMKNATLYAADLSY